MVESWSRDPKCSSLIGCSSTTKSFLPATYCYKLLTPSNSVADKMTYRRDRNSDKNICSLCQKKFREAKFSCQKQRSILLEFDTRAEVDDFQRLVADEHISPPEGGEVWIGRLRRFVDCH